MYLWESCKSLVFKRLGVLIIKECLVFMPHCISFILSFAKGYFFYFYLKILQ